MNWTVPLVIFCLGAEVFAHAATVRSRCEEVHAAIPQILVNLAANNQPLPTRWEAARVESVVKRMSLDLRSEFALPASLEVNFTTGAEGWFYSSSLEEDTISVADRMRLPVDDFQGETRDNPPLVAHEFAHTVMTHNLPSFVRETQEKVNAEMARLERMEQALRIESQEDELNNLRLYQRFYRKQFADLDFIFRAHAELIADLFAIVFSGRADAISRAFPLENRNSFYRDFSVYHRADAALNFAMDSEKSSSAYYVFAPTRTWLWEAAVSKRIVDTNRSEKAAFLRKVFDLSMLELDGVSRLILAGGERPSPGELNSKMIAVLKRGLENDQGGF